MGNALRGRSAVVTGAAGGLGRAIARRFAHEGVRALALADLDADGSAALVEQLRTDEVDVLALGLDVTDPTAVDDAFQQLADRFGGLDVVVNNAGVLSPNARLHNVEPEAFRKVLEVNVLGVFHGMASAVRLMRVAGRGVILNTASVSGFTTWSHASPYCASKAAVIQLTKVAAAEYAKEGIRINCVCPGTFLTRIHDELPEVAIDAITARHPIGRLGTAEEVAGAFVYLAGDDAGWVTGTALVVDGGCAVA